MSAPVLDVDASVLEDLGRRFQLPCEAANHDPAHPSVAAWWARMTHTGCPKVEVTAACDHCKAHDEDFISDAVRRSARCSCTCGQVFPAIDLEVSFTPIRSAS